MWLICRVADTPLEELGSLLLIITGVGLGGRTTVEEVCGLRWIPETGKGWKSENLRLAAAFPAFAAPMAANAGNA